MRVTPWEQERLLIFTAAELARRHRSAGLLLNAPEAVALICDALLEAARAGATYEQTEEAGRRAVQRVDVLDGVAELVDEVRLEVLLGDGTRLIVLRHPLGQPATDDHDAFQAAGSVAVPVLPEPESRELRVTNTSRRQVRVSSHYPFDRVNPRLQFDRGAARGFRLDLPAGATLRWAPGEERTVRLVRYGGTGQAADE